jgi:hypothetical protein
MRLGIGQEEKVTAVVIVKQVRHVNDSRCLPVATVSGLSVNLSWREFSAAIDLVNAFRADVLRVKSPNGCFFSIVAELIKGTILLNCTKKEKDIVS